MYPEFLMDKYAGLYLEVDKKYLKDISVCLPRPNNLGGKCVSLLDIIPEVNVIKSLSYNNGLSMAANPKYVANLNYYQSPLGREEDALLSEKILQLTSYNHSFEADEFAEETTTKSKTKMELSHQNDRVNFDDLGQIYKNISRKKILSKVQCPNIHFHAHSDGTTTIHRHKTCHQEGIYTQDPIFEENVFYKMKNEKHIREQAFPRVKTNRNPENMSSFSLHVEEARYQEMRAGAELSDEFATHNYLSIPSDEEIYTSLGFNRQLTPLNPSKQIGGTRPDICGCRENISQSSTGVKYNPFYIRQKKNEFVKDTHEAEQICNVLLDAVINSGKVTSLHEAQTGCQHCKLFAAKFMKELRTTNPDLLERGLRNGKRKKMKPSPARLYTYKLKGVAYISVVILTMLMFAFLIITILIITLQPKFV